MPTPEELAQLVFHVRGEKIMFDADLAALYGVEARALNQAVKRNQKRFPSDFMFQLTREEYDSIRSQFVTTLRGRKSNSSQIVTTSPRRSILKSQIVTSSWHGGRRRPPYAFTEQGVAMLSSVLRSSRAVEVNIAVVRTFGQLRRLMDSNRQIARKIEGLEKKYDEQFSAVLEAINQLLVPAGPPKKRIGFHP